MKDTIISEIKVTIPAGADYDFSSIVDAIEELTGRAGYRQQTDYSDRTEISLSFDDGYEAVCPHCFNAWRVMNFDNDRMTCPVCHTTDKSENFDLS